MNDQALVVDVDVDVDGDVVNVNNDVCLYEIVLAA